MFEPCFFDKNRLFGFYHPATQAGSDRLLVICPPMFDEYRRSYRALAELAKGCAAEGSHVFRFDYFGTGESWGTLQEATADTWVHDIHAAIEEGVGLSGASRVYLFGVRFGATLAAQVQRPEIVEYIFWDLVASGQEYLAHLASADAEIERSHCNILRYTNVNAAPVPYQMFNMSQALRQGLAQMRVDLPALSARARVHRIVCQEGQATHGAEYSGFPYDWPAFQGGLLLPKPVLEAIARRVR